MTIDQLREELRRQADDHPDLTQLRANTSRPNTTRTRKLAAAAVAAAVAGLVVTGAVVLKSPAIPPTGPAATPITAPSTVGRTRAVEELSDTLRCGEGYGSGEVGAGVTTVLGAVVLDTRAQTPDTYSQQTGPGYPYDPAKQYFAKSAIVVRAGVAATITVAESQRGRARIGWNSNGAEAVDTLRIPACEGVVITPGQPVFVTASAPPPGPVWLTYIGGIWVSEPMCVTLEVTVGSDTESSGRAPASIGAADRQQTIRIPIGAPCS